MEEGMEDQKILVLWASQVNEEKSKGKAPLTRRELLHISMVSREHRPLIAVKGATLQVLLIKTDCLWIPSGSPQAVWQNSAASSSRFNNAINLTMKLSIYIK